MCDTVWDRLSMAKAISECGGPLRRVKSHFLRYLYWRGAVHLVPLVPNLVNAFGAYFILFGWF